MTRARRRDDRPLNQCAACGAETERTDQVVTCDACGHVGRPVRRARVTDPWAAALGGDE